MSRAQRKAKIEKLESVRGSRVVCYVTGDRQPAAAQIGDDAVRPLYDHLRSLGHVPKLDLFIYSRGGAIDVPWRIVTALRTMSDEWTIVVPFRAQSAATLIALGADEIVLGPQGELGPIDPIMSIQRLVQGPGGQTAFQEQISVEDIMAYVRFVQTRAGLSDQAALSVALGKLTERLDAAALGMVYRTHSHIRDVARRILLSRKKPPTEQELGTIIETLAERVYAHGHAIGLKNAVEIGLPARAATADEDSAMWDLLSVYEDDLKLRSPIDPVAMIANTDLHQEQGVLAVVESAGFASEFQATVEVRGRRQMPPTLNVTLNFNAQFPPNLNPNALPAQVQQALQQMLQQAQQALLQQSQAAVQQALQQQAPLLGAEAALRGAHWQRVE